MKNVISGPLGRGSHFRGWRMYGPAWVGTGRAEPRAVWYSFVVMGERMDISVVLSFHHSTERTPKHRQITFQIENICIIWLIFLTGNWRILPLSPTGAFTYCLDSWLQFSCSSNTNLSKLILKNIQYKGAGTTIYNVKWASKLKCCKDNGDIKRPGRPRPFPLSGAINSLSQMNLLLLWKYLTVKVI